jgi:hypothetical protein
MNRKQRNLRRWDGMIGTQKVKMEILVNSEGRRGLVKAKALVAIVALSFVALLEGSASAANQCFGLFGNTVTVEVNGSVTSSSALTGREFGALSSCAGLSAWPIIGSSFKSTSGAIVFAFRSMTVDASGCGAVDSIVALKGSPLSGTLQLHNDRNNFSNTTTMIQKSCPSPLPGIEEFEETPAGPDEQGNSPQ